LWSLGIIDKVYTYTYSCLPIWKGGELGKLSKKEKVVTYHKNPEQNKTVKASARQVQFILLSFAFNTTIPRPSASAATILVQEPSRDQYDKLK